MKNAAANGELAVWGRPYQGPVRDHDPLVPIPAAHFLEYSFRHGALEGTYDNDQTSTSTFEILTKNEFGRKGQTYYDLWLSTSGARAVLKKFKEELDAG